MGIGVPACFKEVFTIPNTSAVSLDAFRIVTVGFWRNVRRILMFSFSRFPPLN